MGLFVFVATGGARSLFLVFVVLIICLATVGVFAGESVPGWRCQRIGRL
jgi:hypothetical protein